MKTGDIVEFLHAHTSHEIRGDGDSLHGEVFRVFGDDIGTILRIEKAGGKRYGTLRALVQIKRNNTFAWCDIASINSVKE